ncbi:hypothetical protein K461DRAFT_274461 [Myriangium duriaei CBS 260.36]|uniref:MINDY deubiquitinase domain-containing protein n=1 Tax=Myriangium duriaei CBS 260.36 TaxID=1168546 RepID=A0A9P4MMF3_9PEZI|nr:hypothetical protein K461DRAFT_274461 [Myriangium duriaei CBS 260.36]
MVTRTPPARKPVPDPVPVPAPLRQAANNPPYPTGPTMPLMDAPDKTPSFEHIQGKGPSAPNGTESRSRASSVSSHGTWNTDPSEPDLDDRETSEIPDSLRPGPKNTAAQGTPAQPITNSNPPMTNGDVQDSSAVWRQAQPGRSSPSFQSQNPYLTVQGGASPSNAQNQSQQRAETPSFRTPSEELAGLMLGSSPSQSNQTAPSHAPPPPPQAAPPVPNAILAQNSGSQNSHHSNPWQQDLDREQQRLDVQKTGALANAPTTIPIPAQTSPKNKQPLIDHAAPQLPPLQLGAASAQPISRPDVETPRTKANKQRNEFYHIKHVNWYDTSAQGGRGALRRSPILSQNANGPCPILALVNALSLSTPEHEDTALVHTLKSREQVTLGLLLDAVFEELVRRNETTGRDLPDIGDLYSFLITLHTGMNVNPDFTRQSASQPGGFEQTREMQLYGAFHIPLVHGWTSPFESETYQAFERSARTFDEALNVQFLEEEFDAKLRAGGLSREEQQVFEDLTAVKSFLTTYPTQLSEYGLEAMSKWMQPGQVAILFRNDHFCTLYKEPTKGTLMTLVTDEGFATHDEVVWESLVDVNGAMAEFFSGDFRSVGASRQSSTTAAGGSSSIGWPSVESRDIKNSANTGVDANAISQSEQEDLDLALALQLQEEEEEASRREEARRQDAHNESLSRQYIDGQSFQSEQRPQIPPRRSQQPPPQPPRSSTPQRAPTPQTFNSSSRTDDGNAPPPSYEQAASDMPYREAGSTPRPPRQGNALGALSALDAQRQQSAFTAQSSQQGPVMAPNYGRRRSSRFSSFNAAPQQGSYAQTGGNGRYSNTNDERCTIM